MNLFFKSSIYILFAIFILNSSSCSSPTSATCAGSNTIFTGMYNAMLSSNSSFTDGPTMDLPTQMYAFEVLANQTLCGFGYQSQPAVASQNYLIEIHMNNGTLLYSNLHSFGPNSVTTFSLPTPIQLTPGNQYIISRTLTNNLGNVSNDIGRNISFGSAPSPFPFTSNGIKVLWSKAYQGTNPPIYDYGMPYIELRF